MERLILGVLIAIAIPLYLNDKKSAYLTAAKVEAHTLELGEQAYAPTSSSFGTTQQLFTANPKLKLSKGSFGVVVWSGTAGYCVAVLNSNGPADPTGMGSSFGVPFKAYFFDSTTGNLSDVPCAAPTGSTPWDNHYIDEVGGH